MCLNELNENPSGAIYAYLKKKKKKKKKETDDILLSNKCVEREERRPEKKMEGETKGHRDLSQGKTEDTEDG